jgi:molybdenum cofactor cytidylyltransferase
VSAGSYAAIILAGGLSSRMQQFKPLLPLGGETITDHIISTFLNCGVDVFLVIGHQQDELRTGIKKREITIVENPDFKQGMFSSIQAGLRALQTAHQAFFIMPVDIPLVREATIRRLMVAAAGQPEKIIYAVYKGKRGHPTLIPSCFSSSILAWEGSSGLKSFLNSQKEIVLEVPVADSNILFDIDTPNDYRQLLERFRRNEVPTDEECEVIFTICRVAPERIRHCFKVAEVAVAISQALNNSGHPVDTELVRTASILHDIAKGQPKHDIAGGQILKEMGFNKVGDIVAVHSELAGGNTGLSLEAKVVYLADKFTKGEKLVTIMERYNDADRVHGLTPEIHNLVLERRDVALKVKAEIENFIGRPLEKIISPTG